MKLVTSLTSPYGRKARAVALERGCALDIVEDTPMTEAAAAPRWNPLGKVPILLLDDGTILYDSPVVCEAIDAHDGRPTLLPTSGPARFAVLRDQALGDGIIDAAFAVVIERRRPDAQRSPYWVDRWIAVIRRALDDLEGRISGRADAVDLGTLTWACALGYLDFRHADLAWRDGRPALAGWFEAISARESLAETVPAD